MTNDNNAFFDAFDKKHILIISEEPRVLAEIKLELMEHFEISIAATSKAALSSVEMFEISAIIIYIFDNRENSFTIFENISELTKSKNIPIIFLSEKGNDADEHQAFAEGAVDYSARRSGTIMALANRINLRITASEYEKKHMSKKVKPGEKECPHSILENKTILVADDVELNRDIISALLEGIEGLTIDFAANGKETVRKFAENPNLYSLILMDVHMPVMDGLEATKAIRKLRCENARDVPIIAATAAVETKEIELCLEAGMNDYIEKPFVYEKILAAAAEHCLPVRMEKQS